MCCSESNLPAEVFSKLASRIGGKQRGKERTQNLKLFNKHLFTGFTFFEDIKNRSRKEHNCKLCWGSERLVKRGCNLNVKNYIIALLDNLFCKFHCEFIAQINCIYVKFLTQHSDWRLLQNRLSATLISTKTRKSLWNSTNCRLQEKQKRTIQSANTKANNVKKTTQLLTHCQYQDGEIEKLRVNWSESHKSYEE